MSTCWLRRADGTLISQVLNPVVKTACSWARRAAGESVIEVRWDTTDEPCLTDILHASPVDGRFVKTWWDTDIELAWWRGLENFEADTIPETPPVWAGPVVAGKARTGFVQVRAWTQEAYVLRSVVGGTLVNYLITGGASDYDFDDDPDLDFWFATVDDDDDPTATFSTTTTGPTYIGPRVALVEGNPAPLPAEQRAGMYAAAILPDSERGNYAQATVAVYIPTGVDLWDEDQIVAGSVSLFQDSEFVEEWDLELEDGWEHDTWLRASAQVRQPPGSGVSYTFLLMGGNGGSIRFGRPRFTRPANVGSPAGEDTSAVILAIADDQVDLVPALIDYEVTPVGIDLSESFRYFSVDHEDAASVLGDFDGYGEWWVSEGVIYWAPTRGTLIESVTVTSEEMSGWEFECDASQASNLLYGQLRPETGDGPPDEVVVGSATPNRLVSVEQIPPGMGPADSTVWCEKALEQKVPVLVLSGVPANYSGLPGANLASYMPGNWMDVEIPPLGFTGVDAIQPTVDKVSWHPGTDKVDPVWVLGGKARQDPLALFTAQMKAAERARRVRRPRPSFPGPRQWIREASEIDTLVEVTLDLPSGLYTVDVEAEVALDDVATSGVLNAQIYKDSLPARTTRTNISGLGDSTLSTSLTVKGPCGVWGRSLVTSLTGASITENNVRMTVSRVAWSTQR